MKDSRKKEIRNGIQSKLSEAYKLHMRDLSSMKRLVDEALELSRRESYPEGESRAFHMLSIYWGICGEYDRALENAHESLRILKDSDSVQAQGPTYNNIGMIFSRMGNDSEAIKHYHRARDIALKTEDRKTLSHALTNIAKYHEDQGELHESLTFHSRALEISRELELDDQIALGLVNVGDLKVAMEEYEEARNNLQKGLELSRSIQNSYVEIAATLTLARLEAQENREEIALEMLDDAMALAREFNNRDLQIVILQTRAGILEKRGCFCQALEVTREYHRLRERIRTQRSRKKIEQLTAAFEIEKKEREAEIYRLRNVELRRAKEKAENADRAKGRFLAMMSHEIRTPLSIIGGMLELLVESDLDEKQKERVRTAAQASRSLLNILNDVLDLSKIEAGKVDYQLVPISVRELLESNISLFRNDSSYRDLDLSAEHDDAIPGKLLGDPHRIGQVLRNLVGNAVKFTEEGSVKVSSELVSLSGDCASVRFSVSDSGPGIARDVLKRLFQPFSQGDEGRRHRGTGLGLSICKMLVEDMGGGIRAESQPGSGSVFSFQLPLRVAGESLGAGEGDEADAEYENIRDMKILLVEDNESISEIARAFLTSFGCSVAQAFDGEEALKMCDEEVYDLILMDVQMPGMTGPEATRVIREAGVRTPVVAVTGHAMSDQLRNYIDSGMNDVVAKPFSRDDLLRVLHKWSGEASS